jgi:ABC-2 type transport system ATP-binding protein
VLLLDEPVNGLDPEGIISIRTLRSLAAEGRTILLRSHLMSEMSLTADHLIVIGRGRLIADDRMDAFIRARSGNSIRVGSPQAGQPCTALLERHVQVTESDGALEVVGIDRAGIGDLALAHDIAIHELVDEQASLEEAFLELTQDSVDYYRPDHQPIPQRG